MNRKWGFCAVLLVLTATFQACGDNHSIKAPGQSVAVPQIAAPASPSPGPTKTASPAATEGPLPSPSPIASHKDDTLADVFRGIHGAKLAYDVAGKKGEQAVTDTDQLKHLEERLSMSVPITFKPGCPIHESVLSLEFREGPAIKLRLATDDCQVFVMDGKYYEYKSEAYLDNRDVLGMFDEVPWDER